MDRAVAADDLAVGRSSMLVLKWRALRGQQARAECVLDARVAMD